MFNGITSHRASEHTDEAATVYTDDHKSYLGMPRNHVAVCHSTGEYVNGNAHTNGIESFWALLKRGYQGTYHHWSPKHLQRYLDEFTGRYNHRGNTLEELGRMVRRMAGKRLSYKMLVS